MIRFPSRVRRNLIARLLLKKRKRKPYRLLPAYFCRKNRYSPSLRSLQCLRRRHARHRSQTRGRSCCFDASMNHESDGGRATATGVERKRVARGWKGGDGGGDEQIREMRSDFAFFFFSSGHSLFTLLRPKALSAECCAILGKSVRVKSEILFLETVPARYYLLAVFQKKHRRRRRRSLESRFGIPSIPRSSSSTLHLLLSSP